MKLKYVYGYADYINMFFRINPKLKIFGNVSENNRTGSRKYPNLMPLAKDVVSISGEKHSEETVTKDLGYDENSKSYIQLQTLYENGVLKGTIKNYFEDKYRLKYRSDYSVVKDDGTLENFTEIDDGLLELRKKIDEITPKFTENLDIKEAKANIELPEYLYHITTKENYEKMLAEGKIQGSNGGIYCVDSRNFKQQWNEHEAWNGNLKENLILVQVAKKKQSDDLVVLKIPTNMMNSKKIRVRAEEDIFYSQDIMQRGQFHGIKEPECVSKGYDWATGMSNFYDNKSLEFIIDDDVSINNIDLIYSGNISKDGISDLISCIENQ